MEEATYEIDESSNGFNFIAFLFSFFFVLPSFMYYKGLLPTTDKSIFTGLTLLGLEMTLNFSFLPDSFDKD